MSISCVLILPASLREKGNQLAEAMGWGPDNYSVPLSPAGHGKPTHYGLHAWAGKEFMALLGGVAAGDAPPEALGEYPAKGLKAVMAGLVISFRDDAEAHFSEALKEQGLWRVSPPEGKDEE